MPSGYMQKQENLQFVSTIHPGRRGLIHGLVPQDSRRPCEFPINRVQSGYQQRVLVQPSVPITAFITTVL